MHLPLLISCCLACEGKSRRQETVLAWGLSQPFLPPNQLGAVQGSEMGWCGGISATTGPQSSDQREI